MASSLQFVARQNAHSNPTAGPRHAFHRVESCAGPSSQFGILLYIKEDGQNGLRANPGNMVVFTSLGAANPAEGLQKLANSPVIAIAEGYATAATVAKYGNVPAIAAFDAGKPADDLANFPRQQCRSVCARR
jgi:hypothetical protein